LDDEEALSKKHLSTGGGKTREADELKALTSSIIGDAVSATGATDPSACMVPRKSPSTGNRVNQRRGRGPLHAPILGALPRRKPTGEDEARRWSVSASDVLNGEDDLTRSTSLQRKTRTSDVEANDVHSHDLDSGVG
jgi:hypothetical protein